MELHTVIGVGTVILCAAAAAAQPSDRVVLPDGTVLWQGPQGPPAAGPAMLVADEIVVEFRAPMARAIEQNGLAPFGFTLVPALDTIGVRYGVSRMRRQFE